MSTHAQCIQKERITELRTQMDELLDNGQPGRISKIEAGIDKRISKVENRVDGHSRMLWMGMGGLYVLNAVAIAMKFWKG